MYHLLIEPVPVPADKLPDPNHENSLTEVRARRESLEHTAGELKEELARWQPEAFAPMALGAVTKSSGCQVRGKLPDSACTPGARFAKVTKAEVCTPGYSSTVRNVSSSTKDAVYTAYGMTRHFNGSDGEVDHLVSLELGGSNARSNLFPEAAPGSHEKDRLENALHAEVCSGSLTLRAAQRLIATNWVAAFRARFG